MEKECLKAQQDLELDQRFPGLIDRMKAGEVATFTIAEELMDIWLDAARNTGCEVERIAGKGETFPVSSMYYKQQFTKIPLDRGIEVIESEPIGSGGYIAISFGAPKDRDNLKSLE